MRSVGSKIVEIDGAFRDDPRSHECVRARNPLKYTGPFLFTPYTRIETGDSLAWVEEGGRVGKKKKERGGKKREKIVERKTIHTGYEILIKLLRLYFFRRFGWIGARTYFFRGGFREKISSYLILLHGGMLRSPC